jgi:hypothetical protein
MTVCAPQRKNSASSYCPPRNSGRDPGRTKYPRRTAAAESDDYFLSDLNLRDPNLSSESGGKIDIIDFKWTNDRLLGQVPAKPGGLNGSMQHNERLRDTGRFGTGENSHHNFRNHRLDLAPAKRIP